MNKNINDKLFDVLVEEAAQRYCNDIANEDISVDMSDAETALMNKQKDRVYQNIMKEINQSKFRWTWRKAAILIAALIAILALSLNATAIKSFIFGTAADITDTKIKIETKIAYFDQYKKIENFKNKSEMIIPEWLPEDMTLWDVKDYEDYIKLQYRDNEVYFNITESTMDSPQAYDLAIDGNQYEITDCRILGMEGNMVHMTLESGVSVYNITWCSDNTSYYIKTNLKGDDLTKILENLNYFEE